MWRSGKDEVRSNKIYLTSWVQWTKNINWKKLILCLACGVSELRIWSTKVTPILDLLILMIIYLEISESDLIIWWIWYVNMFPRMPWRQFITSYVLADSTMVNSPHSKTIPLSNLLRTLIHICHDTYMTWYINYMLMKVLHIDKVWPKRC